MVVCYPLLQADSEGPYPHLLRRLLRHTEINKSLVRAYEHLDLAYESAGCGNQSFSEAMEYVELLRKRIAALAEYIRPYRIKNEHISVYSVLNLIYGESQAFNHLASLVNQIEGASHE